MKAKQESIIARRRILIDEIAQQRLSLAQEVEAWSAPLALVDRGVDVVRYVKRHPLLTTAAITLLLKLRRGGRSSSWIARGLIAWRLFDRFNRLGARTGDVRLPDRLPR